MKIVKIKINPYDQRKDMLLALSLSGYKVWQEEIQNSTFNSDHYVCFEVDDKYIYNTYTKTEIPNMEFGIPKSNPTQVVKDE